MEKHLKKKLPPHSSVLSANRSIKLMTKVTQWRWESRGCFNLKRNSEKSFERKFGCSALNFGNLCSLLSPKGCTHLFWPVRCGSVGVLTDQHSQDILITRRKFYVGFICRQHTCTNCRSSECPLIFCAGVQSAGGERGSHHVASRYRRARRRKRQ